MVVKTGETETEGKSARGRARQRKARDSSASDSSSDSSSSGSSSGSGSSSSSDDSSASPQRNRARGGPRERERRSSPAVRRRRTSIGENVPRRSRSPRRPTIRREHRSPTPKPTKLHVASLTKNIVKEHVVEIFSYYGKVKAVDMPPERSAFPRTTAYVEFEDHVDAEKAVKYMDGGQIDGQVVTVRAVLPIRRRPPPRRPSPPPMGRGGMWGYHPPPPRVWRRSPPRRRPLPPPPRSPPRRRRSPSPRRRRRSRSSSSESRWGGWGHVLVEEHSKKMHWNPAAVLNNNSVENVTSSSKLFWTLYCLLRLRALPVSRMIVNVPCCQPSIWKPMLSVQHHVRKGSLIWFTRQTCDTLPIVQNFWRYRYFICDENSRCLCIATVWFFFKPFLSERHRRNAIHGLACWTRSVCCLHIAAQFISNAAFAILLNLRLWRDAVEKCRICAVML